MKIVDVKAEYFAWKKERPIANGKHTYSTNGLNFVRIETDEGISGIGLGPARNSKLMQATLDQLIPELIGEDPINVERIWHKLWVPKLIGRRGMTTRTISAIDIGLWDIRAKVAGLPLYKLLGGFRDSIPTYVAGGYYEDGKKLPELAREMEEYVSLGAKGVKMKVGALPIREDVERVQTVRHAIGPDVKLLVDANCAFRFYEAIQFAKRIEECDPFWFEEPVAPDDYDGYRKLAESTTIPIAAGENEYTRYGFRDLIKSGGVAILNADAKIMGGITEWVKVAALAQAYGVPIAPHGPQEIHVHLVASAPNGLILEYYPDRVHRHASAKYMQSLELNADGTVSPPNMPGIGIEPNYDFLEQYRVE